MIINQENFCRHWCNTDYDEVIKEQSVECEDMVACSSSDNGMNLDVFVAQGLMLKCQEELFEEALVNFAKVVNHSFTKYSESEKLSNEIKFEKW